MKEGGGGSARGGSATFEMRGSQLERKSLLRKKRENRKTRGKVGRRSRLRRALSCIEERGRRQ